MAAKGAEARKIIRDFVASELFALVFAAISAAVSANGDLPVMWVFLAFAWLVATFGIYVAEPLWTVSKTPRILITTLSALVLGAGFFAFGRHEASEPPMWLRISNYLTQHAVVVPQAPPSAPPTAPLQAPAPTRAITPSAPAKVARNAPSSNVAPPAAPDGPMTVRQLSDKQLIDQLADTAHALVQLEIEYHAKLEKNLWPQYDPSSPDPRGQFKDAVLKHDEEEHKIDDQIDGEYVEHIRTTELSLREEVLRRILITDNQPACTTVEGMDRYANMGSHLIGTSPFQERAACLLALSKLLENKNR